MEQNQNAETMEQMQQRIRALIELPAEFAGQVVVDGEEAIAERLVTAGPLGVAEKYTLVTPAVPADTAEDVIGLLADVRVDLQVGAADSVLLPP